MRPMVEGFRDHLRDGGTAEPVRERLEHFLDDSQYDMEHLIDELDTLTEASEAYDAWGESVDTELKPHIRVAREEAQWYVQHVCERVQLESAAQMWYPLLRHQDEHDIIVGTTNYDRAIELAAARYSLPFHDGFPPFGEHERVRWEGFGNGEGTKLLKLHGSTDWYLSEKEDTVWKLRHPMPLFGGVTLRVPDEEDLMLESAAVLPSREKKVRHPPYPELGTEFRNEAFDADLAVFIGTSLRDPDIREVFHSCSEEYPTFLVNRSGRYGEMVNTDEGTILEQSASRFLISTLPSALKRPDSEVVPTLKDHTERPATEGVLEELITAMDGESEAITRLQAIEELASSGAILGEDEIVPLLEDPNPDVKKYALALVPDSPDEDRLLGVAEEIATQDPDSDFSDEYRLLQGLLKQE